MRYKIHHELTGDWFVVDGETIEECRANADEECGRLGWSVESVWSEEALKQDWDARYGIS